MVSLHVLRSPLYPYFTGGRLMTIKVTASDIAMVKRWADELDLVVVTAEHTLEERKAHLRHALTIEALLGVTLQAQGIDDAFMVGIDIERL